MPVAPASRAGVVWIHHMPGYDRSDWPLLGGRQAFLAACSLQLDVAVDCYGDGAAHSFFSVDRLAYRVEAALDGWRRIDDFFAKHLEG